MFSDPAVGEDFFGRQDVIDLLVKRANALKSGYRQNVAIIGHQQLGKTSILRHFLHVTRDPEVLCVYVEIKLAALDYFVEQFARSLLFRFLSESGAEDPQASLADLSARAAARIPRTVARIEEITSLVKRRHAEEAYARLFELTSIVKQETGRHCIVILDEFHRLGDFGIRNAFGDFGKRIMIQKDTMYVLASSSFSASRKILAEKLSLLFGNFERVYLEPFDFETSFAFLEKKFEPIAVPEPIRHFLVSFTDGHPFFLQTLSSRLSEVATAKAETELSPQTVAEVLRRLLFESQGVLYQYFLNLVSPWAHNGSRGHHVLILAQIAKGRNKLKDIAIGINRSQKETSDQIRELMERELIVKTGVFYRLHNRIFRFWLREVYEKKELSLTGVPPQAEHFQETILSQISESGELLRLDVGERVARLMGLFRNEMIDWGEKKRQLPHFTEILKGSGSAAAPDESIRRITAKGQGRCWVCKIVEERATEREILDLIEGVSKKTRAAQTPVLFALSGLDENAKLLAKEKKVLTLGLSRLNLLMDLYGRAPIIRSRTGTPTA